MSRHGERPEETWVFSFSLHLEVFAKFARGIMRELGDKTNLLDQTSFWCSLLVFYLEVLTDLYFKEVY